ncbi:unnamed protein product [Parnassius apollo]|uniref:(apollo) hypothetical protein n=1 Tax=Parnassius apollo TaxID=110799 RepID=A0A8S3Y6N2_PARAO|nr:unnamed protein product [Parnassius apollo]
MNRTRIITRGRRLCDMVNNTSTQNRNSETPIENNNVSLDEIELNSFRDSNLRNITESPLPISFNESEMNELANIIDGNIFDNLEVATDSDTANLETPHPSPSCSINNLDYDCNNDFCPYYIQKENLSAFDIIPQPSPAWISSCSTYTTINNSPLSDISNNSPTTSDRRRRPSRKDKGNVRKRHYKEWIDNKRRYLRNLGKEYISRKRKIQASRKMGPPCRCRKKCFDKLSEEQRKKIFESFWSLGDREKQWMYVANLVKKQNKRRVYTDTVSRPTYHDFLKSLSFVAGSHNVEFSDSE